MITGIIQARTGSTRLPAKILMDIAGKPLLEHVVERTRASRLIERLVVATTDLDRDQVVADMAQRWGLGVYRGSEQDVLDRFYQAARLFGADTVVRITPDDPFKDPFVIDTVIRRFLAANGGLDYVSNTIKPTYPEGLDIEVFSFQALEKAWREAKKPSEREHATPYIWNHPELFRLANVEHSEDLSSLRWTLDYEADLRFAREVYARLYHGHVFLMEDILALLSREPELALINSGVVRNAGYIKSVEQEQTGQ